MPKLKKIKTVFLIASLLIIFLNFLTAPALADGLVVKYYDPYSDRFDYVQEGSQQAFINYENGLEKLIIGIDIKHQEKGKAVWIFPVPAQPNDIKLDIIDDLPRFYGEEITRKTKMILDDIKNIIWISQLYTIPYSLHKIAGKTETVSLGLNKSIDGISKNFERDVRVHFHLDKKGVSSEIITAKTAEGFYGYLKNKGLNISSNSIPVLNHYIGKNFSFIASWISTQEEKGLSGQKAVFITFPTKNIYYPLIPTSVYGDKVVPTTIRIIGAVRLKIFKDKRIQTKYYIDKYAFIPRGLENFYQSDKHTTYNLLGQKITSDDTYNLIYTKIDINVPSKLLKKDLIIEQKAPIKVRLLLFLIKHSLVITIFLFILISLITSVLTGLIVFKTSLKFRKLVLLGLSNCLSILGIMWATTIIKTKEDNKELKSVLYELKSKKYFLKRKIAAFLFFAVLPLIIFCLLIIPFLIKELILRGFVNVLLSEWQSFLIVYGIPSLILTIIYFLAKIKKKDEQLFKVLRDHNYSSWGFTPQDKRKLIFIPVFSVLFLIMSVVLIELIKKILG